MLNSSRIIYFLVALINIKGLRPATQVSLRGVRQPRAQKMDGESSDHYLVPGAEPSVGYQNLARLAACVII